MKNREPMKKKSRKRSHGGNQRDKKEKWSTLTIHPKTGSTGMEKEGGKDGTTMVEKARSPTAQMRKEAESSEEKFSTGALSPKGEEPSFLKESPNLGRAGKPGLGPSDGSLIVAGG